MFRSQADITQAAGERVTVRHANAGDGAALGRLAELDSVRAPMGEALVAESGARILAALPLGSGRPIADPFEPTSELVALLELRAAQLAQSRSGRSGLRRRVRGLLRARPAAT